MKIAICDDCQGDRAALIPLVTDFFKSNGISPDFFEFDSGETLILAFNDCRFDLVFLDIYMNGLMGIETAKLLKAHSPNVFVIFVSSSTEHGADAFDVDAFHYIIKPVKPAKLFSVLNKWFSLVYDIKTIPVKCGRCIRDVAISEIVYVEVFKRSCVIHTTNETISASMSLSALEELLPKGEFVRPIRYCLVSLRYVSRLNDSNVVMQNDVIVSLSRNERENVKQSLAAYKLRQLRRR